MLTIVQGNRNIYTISKGETDWKAGAKLWPYCKWLPYCSIWRAPRTYLMALFSPRPLAESGEPAASTPGLCRFPCRTRWATVRWEAAVGDNAVSLLALVDNKQRFSIFFLFFVFFSTASKVLITEALERHRVTDEEKGNGWSGARNTGSIKTWLSSAAKRCKVHKQRQRLQL